MTRKITSIVDVPARDPAAAAAYYRSRREAGNWRPDEMEALIVMQAEKSLGEEFLRLVDEIDRDLTRP